MESTGCLRWLLMLVPMSLLTALGFGVMGNGESSPPPPTPSILDATPYYTTQDGTVQFPYLGEWTLDESSPGVVLITNATDWNRVINDQEIQSGEFLITIYTTQALTDFGVNAVSGLTPIIDFYHATLSPDATYAEPTALQIGGRDALLIEFTLHPVFGRDARFYAYALRPDRAVTVSLTTRIGESANFEPLVIGLMERMSYLGDAYANSATSTLYDGGTLPYPTPIDPSPNPTDSYMATQYSMYGTLTLIAYVPYGFGEAEYQMTVQAMSGTIGAQEIQIATLQAGIPSTTPSATAVGAYTVTLIGVTQVGDFDNEAVVMMFQGATNLKDWTLRDSSNTVVYQFPDVSFDRGDQISIFSKFGDDTATELYAHHSNALWESGSTIYIYDSSNRLMDSLVVP